MVVGATKQKLQFVKSDAEFSAKHSRAGPLRKKPGGLWSTHAGPDVFGGPALI